MFFIPKFPGAFFWILYLCAQSTDGHLTQIQLYSSQNHATQDKIYLFLNTCKTFDIKAKAYMYVSHIQPFLRKVLNFMNYMGCLFLIVYLTTLSQLHIFYCIEW
jgi:hypothetical protein